MGKAGLREGNRGGQIHEPDKKGRKREHNQVGRTSERIIEQQSSTRDHRVSKPHSQGAAVRPRESELRAIRGTAGGQWHFRGACEWRAAHMRSARLPGVERVTREGAGEKGEGWLANRWGSSTLARTVSEARQDGAAVGQVVPHTPIPGLPLGEQGAEGGVEGCRSHEEARELSERVRREVDTHRGGNQVRSEGVRGRIGYREAPATLIHIWQQRRSAFTPRPLSPAPTVLLPPNTYK